MTAFLANYTKRKKITIDHANVDGDLTDFPLLVVFTNDAAIGAAAHATGQNIRFTSSNGETLLKYERQSFSITSGQATGRFWVKVPTIAGASNTEIYIYYDNSVASDGQDATNVWDSNFAAVYHLEQDPSGTAPQIQDSTANNNDGTSAGSMTSGDLVAGKIGNGLDFDADDYVSCGNAASLKPSKVTVEAWVKPNSPENFSSVVSFNWSTTHVSPFHTYKIGANYTNNAKFNSEFYNGSSVVAPTAAATYSNGTTYHVVGRFDGSTAKLYVNGSEAASTALTGNLSYGTGQLRINANAAGGENFIGVVDEVRISSVARAPEWIKFTYYNINESDNELTFGSEEALFVGIGVQATLPRGARRYVSPPTSSEAVHVPPLPTEVNLDWAATLAHPGRRSTALLPARHGWQLLDPPSDSAVPFSWLGEVARPLPYPARETRDHLAITFHEPVAAVPPALAWYVHAAQVFVARSGPAQRGLALALCEPVSDTLLPLAEYVGPEPPVTTRSLLTQLAGWHTISPPAESAVSDWLGEPAPPVPARAFVSPDLPAFSCFEPVLVVLPPFEWYCGLEPPTPATRVAWRGATGSLTLLPSLWATEYEPGVGYFEISDHFSLGMFP